MSPASADGLLSDGIVVPEGAAWDSPQALKIPPDSPMLVYDLGTIFRLESVYLQADANDRYQVLTSEDGESFELVADFTPVPGHGLRSRHRSNMKASARYLALKPLEGDRFYSATELVAACTSNAALEKTLKIVHAPQAVAHANASGILTVWNNQSSLRWEFLLAAIGMLVLMWRNDRGATGRRHDRILATLGVIAGLTYFNFGFFHFGNYIHNWDTFHYYVGAKYFRELGYERLYDCVVVADAEDVPSSQVAQRKITNLRNNVIGPASEVLSDPHGRCKSHFTDQRWLDFKHDVAYFRSREDSRRWADMLTDHGFNATPVWAILGTYLSNTSPVEHGQVLLLTFLDPVYWLIACGLIGWAFGWRVLSVSLLVLATFYPARFFWTGGSFLRWDWLFYTVAAVCCLRKGYPFWAGIALGYAMLLRIFPGALFIGPLLLAGSIWIRARRLDRNCVRFCAGGLLAVALLVPLGAVNAGSFKIYANFYDNSAKHTATPLTNNMGLRTVLSYRPSQVGRYLRSDALVDPWSEWKAARLEAFDRSKPIFALLILGYLALLWRAVRQAESWMASVLSATMIVVLFELTSYYYAFIWVVALVVAREVRYGPWLLGLTAFSTAVAISALPFVSTWDDEHYTLISLAALLVFSALLWDFGQKSTARNYIDPSGRNL